MLLHSLALLTLLATLATAAPTANPLNNNDAASEAAHTREVIARDSAEPFDNTGLSIRCFDGLDCAGDIIFATGDWIGITPGYTYSWGFQHDPSRLASCRFDTWNDLQANFHLSTYMVQNAVSDVATSDGWGQNCVNQWAYTTESIGMNIEKIVVVFRNPPIDFNEGCLRCS